MPREPGPLVSLRRDRSDHAQSPLARALHREIDGEIRFDRGTRALYATDASNYRQVPIGVVVPRTIDAVIATVAVCREHGAAIFARGGGTSLAGQTCNEAVVIDCSRHLTRIAIDRDAGVADVEPGAIMKSLRVAANAVGLDFGPDPSTQDRCTLGGMLGDNSCGVHSVFSEFYGPGPRTSDHVEELDVLTYRGQRLRAGPTDVVELRRVRDLGGDLATIYDRLLGLRDRYAPLVRDRFPAMPRRVSGYNLPDLLDENGCHVGRALVGSESTCVMILGAKLRLMCARPARALAVLGYGDIYAAAAAANLARSGKPICCEAMDDVLIRRIRRQHRDHDHALALLPEGHAWLMVEHGADTVAEARAAAAQTARLLDPHRAVILDDPHQLQVLADMREQALGVDAFEPGKPDNYEGWEDSAVPPDRLAAYKAEFMAHHYEGRLRPREAYTFGWLHRWLGLARPLAPLANFFTHARGLRVLVKRLAGIAPEREVPWIARRSFRRTFRPPVAPAGARRAALFHGNPRAERLSKQTHTLGEFLVAAGFQPPRVPAKHILYHRHCHHAAVLAREHDIALLRAAGHDVEVLDSGCCGMAGAFGFQRAKYELSVALAERVLLPAIRANPSATIVADGFSCREQLRQLGNFRARHLAELLTDLPVLA